MEQSSFVLFQKIYDTNSLYNFDSSVMKVVEFQWTSGFYIQMDNLIGVIHQWYPNLRRGRGPFGQGRGGQKHPKNFSIIYGFLHIL